MPTAPAETLYPKAKAILDDLKQLKDEITSSGEKVAGELNIGASTIPGAYILPRYAAAFKKLYPGVSFDIKIYDSTFVTSAIHEKRLLLGVVGNKSFSRQIEFTPLATDRLIVIASPENKIPSRIDLESLKQYPFISRENGSGTRKNIEKKLSNSGFSIENLNIVGSLGSSTAVKEAVMMDLGISIISHHAVKKELEMGWLKKVDLTGFQMERIFYLARLAKRTLPNQYKVFHDYLIYQLSQANK